MGQPLHGGAKTTHAVRAELQRSQAPVAQLAERYGINEKTVIRWRSRQSMERRSTVLSPMDRTSKGACSSFNATRAAR
jgi:hypothetical protein